MINQVYHLNKNLIVYIQTVSEVNVNPFKENARAILWSSYNGQAQGNAAGRLLFGEANPSGKLPFTWYKSVGDLAAITDYALRPSGENKGRTYQYFAGEIAYPFGYGMSYTNYEYSNLKISQGEITPDGSITVSFDLKNIGGMDGSEVAQMYVISPNADGKNRPKKRLRGFKKCFIEAGKTVSVSMELRASDLWYWDSEKGCETFDKGKYVIEIGSDSRNCERMTAEFELKGGLTKKLFAVTAIPSGHIMSLSKKERLKTDLTASFNGQSFVDLKAAKIQFESTNDAVAAVDETGTVSPIGKGFATIFVRVTVAEKTKSVSFAVKVAD